MANALTSLLVAASLLLSSCGGGVVFGDFDGDDNVRAVFVFRVRGHGTAQDFHVATRSDEFVRRARAELALPVSERRLVVNGRVLRGSGGFNEPWSWRLEDAQLDESQAQVCNALPAEVEANLSAWIDHVGRFCPGAGFVLAEV